MDNGEKFRKAFHMSAPVFLVYYLFPKDAWGVYPGLDGVLQPREAIVLTVVAVVLTLEALRLKKGWMAFGMRPYESGKMAAHAWAALGLAIGFIFFPMPFVAAALLGMAWVDPLLGLARGKASKTYPILPLVVYWVIAFATMGALGTGIWTAANLSLVGACAAVLCESPRLDHVDDDFLMLTLPPAIMLLVDTIFSLTFGMFPWG